ncbi:SRPBCC family protein [Streptomyces mesophilus]|uniref:SRPBCC family protein n=1 Tax=Streptomyces mesophilus TaxID=1775132 RepID=UPI00332892C3
MSSRSAHFVEHTVSVAAPASAVFGLLTDAPRWPLFLPSYMHVERMEFDGVEEHLWVWELVAGRIRSTRIKRVLRPEDRSVDYEEFAAGDASWPGAVASGTWSVAPEDAARSSLTLRCESSTQTPDELDTDVLLRLDGLRRIAEQWDAFDEILLSFQDTTRIDGPPELVYDFLYRVQDWADLLPHIDAAEVCEERPGVQIAVLETCAAHTGLSVTAQTVRLCFPAAGRIVYKETLPPDLVAAHTGEWSIEPGVSGVTLISTHQVLLRPQAVAEVLGPDARLVDARHYVREWFGRDGRAALSLAKWRAESQLSRLR